MVPIYKQKGDVTECRSYRGIYPMERVMKLLERVVDRRLKTYFDIDEMEFGYMYGMQRNTGDTRIVRNIKWKH